VTQSSPLLAEYEFLQGTALRLRTALAMPVVPVVADIGTGYGPLAIRMLVNGNAAAAVASDIDAFALYLAHLNARRVGLQVTLQETPDPAQVPPTPLTLCNVPTHLQRERTTRLLDGLARRASAGHVLLVVHASLEVRYTEHMRARGMRVSPTHGEHRVVLEAKPADRPPWQCTVPVTSRLRIHARHEQPHTDSGRKSVLSRMLPVVLTSIMASWPHRIGISFLSKGAFP
jgi:precorrin-6B methylase 2